MVSIRVSVKLPDSNVFQKKKWLDEIARTQRQTSVPRLKKLFQQSVFGWGKKPDFGWAQVRTNDEISIRMYPVGQYADLWELINEGSPAHIITPRKPRGFLRFRPGYRAALQTSIGQHSTTVSACRWVAGSAQQARGAACDG